MFSDLLGLVIALMAARLATCYQRAEVFGALANGLILLGELGTCMARYLDAEHPAFQLESEEHAAHEEPMRR